MFDDREGAFSVDVVEVCFVFLGDDISGDDEFFRWVGLIQFVVVGYGLRFRLVDNGVMVFSFDFAVWEECV